MSATELKRTLLGCLGSAGSGVIYPSYAYCFTWVLGSAGSGAIYPSYAYCLGSVVPAYFIKDDSKLKSENRV